MKPILGDCVAAFFIVSIFVIFESLFTVVDIFLSWSPQKRFFNLLFSIITMFDIWAMTTYALDMDAIRVLYSLCSISICIYGLHVVNSTKE